MGLGRPAAGFLTCCLLCGAFAPAARAAEGAAEAAAAPAGTTAVRSGREVLEEGRKLRRAGRGFEMLALFEAFLFDPNVPLAAEGPPPAAVAAVRLPVLPWEDEERRQMLTEIAQVKEHERFAARYRQIIGRQPPAASPEQEQRWRADLAHLLWEARDYDGAEQQFEALFNVMKPPLVSWCLRVGSLDNGAGRLDDAMRWYERARDLPITDADLAARRHMSARIMTSEEMKQRIRREVLSSLGTLYRKKGRLPEAEACFREIGDQKELSAIWNSMGKTNEFAESLRRDLAKDPTNPALNGELARLLMAMGKPAEAAELFARALQPDGDDPAIRAELARALAAAQRTDDAIAEYRRVLASPAVAAPPGVKLSPPVSRQPYLSEVDALCRKAGRTDILTAIWREEVQRIRAERPAAGESADYRLRAALERLTELLRPQGAHQEIVDLWLADRKPLFYHARENLLRSAAELPDTKRLLARLERLVRDDPQDHQASLLYADLLWLAGKRDQAIAQYDTLSARLPPESALRRSLADAFHQRELPEKELAEYDRIIQTCKAGSEEYVNALGMIALLNRGLGRNGKAMELYEQCLALRPADAGFRNGYVASRQALGLLPPAAAEVAPDDDPRADLLAEQGKLDEAMAIYQRLRQARPTDVGLLVRLAKAQQKAGLDDAALASFEEAYRLRYWSGVDYGVPGELENCYSARKDHERLAQLYKELRRYSDLKRLMKSLGRDDEFLAYLRLEAEKPDGSEARNQLGVAYLERGMKAEARALYLPLFEQAMAADPVDSGAALTVARGLEELGDFDKGIALLERAQATLDAGYRRWVLEALARLYGKSGRLDRGLATVESLAGDSMDNYQLDQLTAMIAEFVGDNPERRAELERFLRKLSISSNSRHATLHIALRRRFPETEPSKRVEPLDLIETGVLVLPPADAPNLWRFIEALAGSAGTLARGSFNRVGLRSAAPTLPAEKAGAYDLLARAISGTNASLELTQEGYWSLNEGNQPRFYAAGGAVLFVVSPYGKAPKDEGNGELSLQGNILSDPAAGVIARADPQLPTNVWHNGPQGGPHLIRFTRRETAPGRRQWIGEVTVVACGGWSEPTVADLDTEQPRKAPGGGPGVSAGPLRLKKEGDEEVWELPVQIGPPLRDFGGEDPRRASFMTQPLPDELKLRTADGRDLKVTGHRTLAEAEGAFWVTARAPAGTSLKGASLRVRAPTIVRLVTLPLELYNVPKQ